MRGVVTQTHSKGVGTIAHLLGQLLYLLLEFGTDAVESAKGPGHGGDIDAQLTGNITL